MSKGMRNLMAMTNVAQKHYSTIVLHTGINELDKTVKFTDDKDCLPGEITRYRLTEFFSSSDLWEKITKIEELGYFVCVDTSNLFYETGDTEVKYYRNSRK